MPKGRGEFVMKRWGIRAVFLPLVLLAGCGRSKHAPAGPRFGALMAASADMGAAPELTTAAWDSIDTMSTHIRERHQRGDEKYEALFTVLFRVFHYERELIRDDPRFYTFTQVLKGRRGTSLGLSEVALVLAERLGLPLEGVVVPGHVYVRVPGAPHRNFELLRRAESFPDAWYRTTYGPWTESGTGYGRGLSPLEIAGLAWFQVGEFHRKKGERIEAKRDYGKANQTFPDFIEIQAKLEDMIQSTGSEP